MRTKQNKSSQQQRDLRKSAKKGIKCICPKCARVHKMKMIWTGRGIPRKYCLICLKLVKDFTHHPDVEYHNTRLKSGMVLDREAERYKDTSNKKLEF